MNRFKLDYEHEQEHEIENELRLLPPDLRIFPRAQRSGARARNRNTVEPPGEPAGPGAEKLLSVPLPRAVDCLLKTEMDSLAQSRRESEWIMVLVEILLSPSW